MPEHMSTMEERARELLLVNYHTYLLAMSEATYFGTLASMATPDRAPVLRRRANDYMDTAILCRQFARDITEVITGHSYWLEARIK